MTPTFPRVLVLALATLLLAACGGSDVPSGVTGRDKERLESAFAKADQGKDPVMDCAALTGSAIGHAAAGNASASAGNAFETCYVDVRARYFEALLKHGPANEACMKITSSAMIWRMSLGGVAKEHGWDTAALDRRMADKVSARVGAACEDSVVKMLRGG